MNRCPQCGADRWTVDENAPYCDNSWHLEAPSDDCELITAAWMIEEYGSCDLEVPPDLGVAVDQDNAVFLEIATASRYAQTRLPHIRTRGQLRQLLALLGYQEKDSVR